MTTESQVNPLLMMYCDQAFMLWALEEVSRRMYGGIPDFVPNELEYLVRVGKAHYSKSCK